MSFAHSINYSYDAVGNFTRKTDYSLDSADAYQYVSNTNRVSSVELASGGTVEFGYDNKGNQTHRNNIQEITYNTFNKPTAINRLGSSVALFYGSDLMRYKQVRNVNGKTTTTYYINKLFEVEHADNKIAERSYISDIVILEESNYSIAFTHRDRSGSAVTFTDHNGKIVAFRSFDPFGKPKMGDGSLISSMGMRARLSNNMTDIAQATRKGFTDHEHLDEVELIHMNGRVYDYNLGRFLSVDPFIQGVGNSQGINPYSYVMNNPLGYTDPTGYTAEKEVEVKRAPKLGSRLGRSQTVTVTAKDGGLSISGGNGAARSAVRGALTNSLPSAEFNVSDIGSQTQIAKNDSSSGKQLTSVSRGKATSTTSGLKKSAHKSLEELRKKPEFAELEKKHGALTLTFDNKKKTELDGNTININKSIFSIEYEVDADASMDAYGGTLPDSMSDGAYYGAIERYQQSLPEYSAFSMNRVIVHEAFHLMQKHVSGFEYTINREHYEAKNIRRANQFMHKYFNEPFRDENHGKARSR